MIKAKTVIVVFGQSLKASIKAHKKITLAAVITLVVLGGYFYKATFKQTATAAPVAARVQVAKAVYADNFDEGMNTTGTLRANEDVVIKSKVETIIKDYNVKKGQRIEKGQLLVELEHHNQTAQVQAAQSQISVNEAAAASAHAELTNAIAEQRRYDTLVGSGAVSRQQADAKQTVQKVAASDYARANSNVEQANAQLAAAEATLNDYLLMAPFNGIVLDDYDMTVGSKVAKDTNVLRVADIDKLKLTVSIPENDMERIKVGMPVKIVCDSLPGDSFQGRVEIVNPYIDTNTHMLQADVYINNKEAGYRLKPGMFAKVMLVEKAQQRALVIPKEAVRQDGTVLVVEAGKAKSVHVRVALTADKLVSISDGIKEGDVVVISGGTSVKDGDQVTYKEDPQ